MGPKVRCYPDEHGAEAVTHGLRQRGVDGLTVGDASMRGAADEEQRAWAGPRAGCSSRRTLTSCACMGRVFSPLASVTRRRAPR